MDLIMAVAKSTATSGADVSPAVRHDGVAGSDFAALMNSKRSADTLANSPLIQAVRGMSESHRNTLTNQLVNSFEKNQKTRNASERFVSNIEDVDAVMTQKSRMSMMEIVTRSTIKNIETLTTKMS
ncbi:MAG: hypothetical protein HEQ39_13415 [Rhizobacter sp.]